MYICGLGKLSPRHPTSPQKGLLSRLSESSFTTLNSAWEWFQFAQPISFNTTYAAFSVAFKLQNAAEPQNDGFQTGRFFPSLDIWDPEVVVLGVFFLILFHTNK